jgi:leader peptidase (prepilin peptidase)/N-methyltransferase
MVEAWLVPLWDGTPKPLLAGGLGALAAVVSLPLIRHTLTICEAPPTHRPWKSALATGLLVALYAWLMLSLHVQRIDEVRPSAVWDRLRILHHAVLIVLLAAATFTDWKTCFIPDVVPIAGTVWGVALAVISGDLQMQHVWVDWNEAVPGFFGPQLPDWMDAHHHWHGLAWSLAGAGCGAALTGVVRCVSKWALGIPALGTGDIWLLAMIGCFLGWQATVIAFLLAPVLALTVGLPLKFIQRRPYIPYGPFLALSAYIVLCSWRWIWMLDVNLGSSLAPHDRRASFSIRRLFGDPAALAAIAAVIVVALAIMLGWRRWQSTWTVSR